MSFLKFPQAGANLSPFLTPQQQQLQQQQGLHLASADGNPLSYQAKWNDIHPDSQRLLLEIEARILEYRDESLRLDQCQRLYDTSALHKGFEADAARFCQELSGISAAVDREHTSVQDLMHVAKDLIRNAEVAVRSFTILRQRLARPSVATAAAAPVTAAAPASLLFSAAISPAAPPPSQAATPVVEFYCGVPVKPSPFLQQTVARFEHDLTEYRQRIEELERLLLSGADKENGTKGAEYSMLQSLPTVMSNVHDFFIHVAAEVEALHQQMGVLRTAFLADRRRRGDDSDPFVEADRREAAKQEAAARRVHPTLNATSLNIGAGQLGALQGPSMFASNQQAAPSTVWNPAPAPAASTSFFGSGLSTFGTPATPAQQSPFGTGGQTSFGQVATTPSPGQSFFGSSTPGLPGSSNPGLFGTPSGLTFGSTTPALFGSTAPSFGTPSPSPGLAFGGASTPGSLFGNTPATPFGATPSPGTGTPFGATPAPGTGTPFGTTTPGTANPFGAAPGGGLFGQTSANLFGTPSPAFGAPSTGGSLLGSGLASTQQASSARPRPRGARRR